MKNFVQYFLIVVIFLMQGILLSAQEQPELIIPIMHDMKVTDASFSPNGKFVATCSEDNTIKLWNTLDGKLLRNFLGHGDNVVSVEFNSDGTKLLTASQDSTAIIWHVLSGKILHKLKLSNPKVNRAKFSPNEERVLVSFNYSPSAQIWDYQNDSIIHNLTIPFHKISSAEYSSDGKFILTYYNGYYENNNYNTAQIWDAEKGILLHKLIGHENTITCAKISLDNKKIITASNDKTIKIWETESGKLLSTLTNKIISDNNYFDLSSDGQKIIIASGKKSILEINITTKSEKKFEVTNKYDSEIIKVFYSKNDKNVMAVSKANRIIKFDAITGAQIQTIGWEHVIMGVEISPDGEQMISYGNYSYTNKSDGSAAIYNIETGQLLIKLGEKLGAQNPLNVSLSSSGKYMCHVFEKFSHILEIKTGNILHVLKGPFYYGDCVVEFSPNDSLLAISSSYSGVSIWDVNSGQLLQKKITHNDYINSIVFSKDSKLLLSSSVDNKANVWEAKLGNLIHSIQHKDLEFADFSPDSKYAITTSRDNIKIWSVENGKIFRTIDKKTINLSQEKYFLPKISKFTPDGKYIIIGTYVIDTPIDRNIISILNANTYELVRTIEYLEKNPCENMMISTDSKRLIINTRIFHGGSYQTMREFDIETGKLITNHDLKGGFLCCVDWNNQLYIARRNSKIVFCNLKDDSEILSRIVTWGIKEKGGSVFMETLSIDPNGHFDGDASIFSKLYFVNKLETIPLDAYFEEFYTPNLWARTLHGDMIEKTVINLETQKPLPLIAFIRPPVGKIKFRGDSNASLKTDNIDYELEYSITDQGGGINEIRVFQNGKLIYSDLPKINQLDKSITHKLPIKLISGTNTLLITAFNDDRIEKSETAVIDFTGKEIEPSRLFMLCIGINEYQKSSYNLNFAVPDASSFLNAINTGSKDLFTEVILDSIKNKDATKANILSSIKKIQGNCKPNDVFIFYYAGHGVMNEDIGAKSSLYYIVPHEITNFYNKDMLKQSGISANEITEFSKNIKAQKQIFILDACQSGGALDQIASRGAVEEKAIAVLARSTGTYFLVASNSEQLASEFAALGHGVFTYSLLLGLTGQADSDQDKKISIKELSLFVESKVPELSEQFKGNAQYPASYGYGQDFPISLSDKYKMESKITIPTSKYSSYSLEELIKMKEEAIKSEEYLKAEELKIEIGKRK